MNEPSHVGGTLTLCIIVVAIAASVSVAAGYFKYAALVERATLAIC